MRVEIPQVLLNQTLVLRAVKLNAESVGRFRVKGIALDKTKEKPFDIAILNTTFQLEGLSPSLQAHGMLMDWRQPFTLDITFKILSRDLKIRYKCGEQNLLFNNKHILEFIQDFVRKVILLK